MNNSLYQTLFSHPVSIRGVLGCWLFFHELDQQISQIDQLFFCRWSQSRVMSLNETWILMILLRVQSPSKPYLSLVQFFMFYKKMQVHEILLTSSWSVLNSDFIMNKNQPRWPSLTYQCFSNSWVRCLFGDCINIAFIFVKI